MLAIGNCQFIEHCNLEHLGSLLHLRYLVLRGTNINELLRQIGDLKFLQTVDEHSPAKKVRVPLC